MSSPLAVFALDNRIPPLSAVWAASRDEELPMQIGVAIAGEADPDQLEARDWDSAFLRWIEPELHDIALLATYEPDEEEAASTFKEAFDLLEDAPKDRTRAILEEHLRNVKRIYMIEPLPALRDADDHPGWSGIDLVLRTIAAESSGIIYAEGEGFYLAEGAPFYTPEWDLDDEENEEDDENNETESEIS